jgi:FtsP/CotA-like multicopper oxidase with cupredoxin domain
LIVHGFCPRDGSDCPTLAVPAGEMRQAEFSAGRPGTYHYWATSMGAPVPFREMGGALVVDPRGGAVAADRVLVITEWNNLTPDQMRQVVSADDSGEVFVKFQPRLTFVLNGLSWPATERLTYRLGERVNWRVINLTSQQHQTIGVGETYDFEVDTAPGRAVLWVEVRSPAGKWLAQGHVVVK